MGLLLGARLLASAKDNRLRVVSTFMLLNCLIRLGCDAPAREGLADRAAFGTRVDPRGCRFILTWPTVGGVWNRYNMNKLNMWSYQFACRPMSMMVPMYDYMVTCLQVGAGVSSSCDSGLFVLYIFPPARYTLQMHIPPVTQLVATPPPLPNGESRRN